ncbi:MAG TPA: HNH endonuclease [Thermoplasmata archaeon]|nr:HNH endonuclease [Thermoplasmata archaeon]
MRAPGAPTARILRDSRLWFSEGRNQKDEARRRHRCVECQSPLSSGRTPYCGRVCQWRFRGRYFWDAARTYVIHRDRFTCQYCGRRRRVGELDVDHIVELARGGPSLSYDNLQTLCRSCHRAKTSRFLRERAKSPPRAPSSPDISVATSDPAGDWFPA